MATLTPSQKVDLLQLQRIDEQPTVRSWAALMRGPNKTMFDAAEAQLQQIHNLMNSEEFNSTRIQYSIQNINLSVEMYRHRIPQIKEDPGALWGEPFPDATIEQVTLGIDPDADPAWRRTVGQFEKLVNEIEDTIPVLRELSYDETSAASRKKSEPLHEFTRWINSCKANFL